ncbi:MAG: methylenetetrahydrofolate reductase [Verrucomicrobiota bacterium]
MFKSSGDSTVNWTLEIVPAHADRIDVLQGIVGEIYITMIPGTDVQDSLIALAQVLEKGFTPVPHITARNFKSESELFSYFAALRQLKIKKVLVLAGGHGQPEGPYTNSMDILTSEAFAQADIESVAVAGHPEGNPDDPDTWNSLLLKFNHLKELGIDMEIVTQWSFSPENINKYLQTLQDRGIDAPVRVGIAGPASLKTLLKFAKVCGVNAAATVVKKQGFSMGRLLISNEPEKFIAEVRGTQHFHLYPFGGLEKCSQWLKAQIVSA